MLILKVVGSTLYVDEMRGLYLFVKTKTKKMKRYKLFNIIAAATISKYTFSRRRRNQGIIWSYLHGWEYESRQVSVLEELPLPLPEEIQQIDSYAWWPRHFN